MAEQVWFLDEQPTIDTGRLVLRPIERGDAGAMFAMDSSPRVHEYLGKTPITDIAQAYETIDAIHEEYQTLGIGRWAVVDKADQVFVGWAGFKWMREPIGGYSEFLDIGYRYLEEVWGRGYASECALACMDFRTTEPRLLSVPLAGMVVDGNAASEAVLRKVGLQHTASFDYLGFPVKLFEEHAVLTPAPT